MAEASGRASYEGPIALGMVFDYAPGKRHAYERLTVTRHEGKNIWAFGRSGETYHDEDSFRKVVVFVSEKPIPVSRISPVALSGRYDGPIELGMVFDYEPGKRHAYERLTITRREGKNIWAFGRSGETYHDEDSFRDRVARVPQATTLR